MLLVDVGNSRIKWALWDGGQYYMRGQAAHGAQWADCAAAQWQSLPKPTEVWLVSVAGSSAQQAISGWIAQHWGITAHFVTSSAASAGVRNAYLEPQRLGADRWVALIAAHALTKQHCYVVDCGTALTIDALAADGQHLGGVIVPGMRLMRDSLYRETRQIPPEASAPQLLGCSTSAAVWGGALYAVAAAIDGITERMSATAGAGMRILTGGDAPQILPHLQGAYRLEPELLLYGLRVIAEVNA